MKYIVANFKMNPGKQEDIEAWLGEFQRSWSVKEAVKSRVRVVLCPPFVWLPSLQQAARSSKQRAFLLGAQDVFWERNGPYTGEISSVMLREVGCEYAIVGHSERRALGETDEIVNKKIKAAFQAGLKVILAVGEVNRADESGTVEREVGQALEKQIFGALAGIPRTKLGNLLVAYEPLWAVGSGIADTPEDALKAALFIRKCVAKITGARARAHDIPVLYGGSVTSKNAASFLQEEALNGVLVGNASLNPREFFKIVEMGFRF